MKVIQIKINKKEGAGCKRKKKEREKKPFSNILTMKERRGSLTGIRHLTKHQLRVAEFVIHLV